MTETLTSLNALSAYWRGKPGIAAGIAVSAAVFVLAGLALHNGRAQERRRLKQEDPQSSAHLAAAAKIPGTPVRGHISPAPHIVQPEITPSAPLPLTPINPALAAFQPTPELLVRGPENPPRVALTFDAGSDARAVPLILKMLEERHVHATFFLTGRFCEKFPAECRAIADAGMELGNHSYRHPHFTRLSEAKIRQELDRAEEAIVKVCGRGAKPLFRFPYGDCDERTQKIVAAAGYQPIRWTLDSLDAFRQPKTADFVADRINRGIKPGYITLMHVSCLTSAEALPRIFEQLDRMGAQVVPVSELLLSAPPSHPTDSTAIKEKIDQ